MRRLRTLRGFLLRSKAFKTNIQNAHLKVAATLTDGDGGDHAACGVLFAEAEEEVGAACCAEAG